jgi:regulator of RNase E activity RraA
VIFGDVDGVCVIPAEASREVLSLALEKASAEKRVRADLEAGQSAAEVFERDGIL